MRSETRATDAAVKAGERRAAHNVARKSSAGKSIVVKVAALGVVLAVTGSEVARADWYRKDSEGDLKPAYTDPFDSSVALFALDSKGSTWHGSYTAMYQIVWARRPRVAICAITDYSQKP